ncbi:MAG TPA: hypothetical protein VIO85_10135 [Candidatus Dormibacteraeota bacterium]
MIAVGLVVGIVGALVGPLWQSGSLLTSGLALIALMASPAFAIAAIVAGHVSSRRYPAERLGRVGLIVGYCVLGSIVLLAVIGTLTWLSIGKA